jgi:16S rRNA (guanine527-N7)-methyltransferase
MVRLVQKRGILVRKQRDLALTASQIAAMLAPFGVKLSDEQIASFSRYLELLIYWNETVNLTAVSDPEEIVARHFGEGIFALSILPISHGRLADVGSGAGFPGLPLKIISSGLEAVLLEPNLKKCAFLAEVVAQLRLEGVLIERSRYEEYRSEVPPFDFVVSRALGNYKTLLRWANRVLKESGKVVLWLGAEDSMLVGRSRGWEWGVPVPIPGSRRRVILIGRPSG